MSERWPGGLISPTAPNPPNSYNTTKANGVWTLDQAAYLTSQNLWPNPNSDQYFNYNTLLLNGDGTNGAQNNTFLDSSTNNFTITRNGNTTQGSFSPYGNLWSNYFNGNGNYLSTTATSAFNFTGDWTMECWANISDAGRSADSTKYGNFFGCGTTNSLSNGWDLYFLISGGVITELAFDWGSSFYRPTVSIPLNTWFHVACVRSGTTVTIYLNGTSVGTTTVSGTINGSSTFYVGQSYYGGSYVDWIQGYLSSVRINNTTAVYTSNFTPSTTPLTAISGTSLLTCQSNRFIDNSSNAFAITVNGTPSVQRFSPFNPTSAYSTSVIGGSGYFSATSGDNISAASTSLTFSSGNYTIEAWVYVTAYATTANTILMNASSGAASAYFPRLSFTSTVIQTYDVASNNLLTFSGTVPLNAWTHVALSKSGTSVRAFINGIQAGSTATDSYTWSNGGQPNNIGGVSGTANFQLKGYMTDLRVNNTTALYTTNFTPPTAPETAVSGTQLLLNYVNAGIPDLAMQNNLQTVGSAQVSTSVKKYGTGSLSFNGSNSQLSYPSSVFGAGDFTVESWVYFNSTSGDQAVFGINFNSNANSLSAVRVDISSGVFRFMGSTDGSNFYFFQATSTSPSTNTWYHIALVRNSGTVTFYVNGTSAGSVSSVPNALYAGTGGSRIGSIVYSSSNYLNGYVDDLRVTNGLARYTANFTPPTAALPTY